MRWPALFRSGGQPYDDVVSLGRGCQPAHQIRRLLGVTSAHVFDWIITTDAGLVALIASDLEGFFARDRLAVRDDARVIDRLTETQFFHEFPKGCDFDAQYEQHAGRFAMLVERWRELLASGRRVLFVRQHGWDADARASAVRLREAIRGRAPRLQFTILYLTGDPAQEASWKERDIINRRLIQPEPYDWKGDDAAWERLLKEALAMRQVSKRADKF